MRTAHYGVHLPHLQTWLIVSAISKSERWSWHYSYEESLPRAASPPRIPPETRPIRILREGVVAGRRRILM